MSKAKSTSRGKSASKSSGRSTVSGPAAKDARAGNDPLSRRLEGTQKLVAAMPFNSNKSAEYGRPSFDPRPGVTVAGS